MSLVSWFSTILVSAYRKLASSPKQAVWSDVEFGGGLPECLRFLPYSAKQPIDSEERSLVGQTDPTVSSKRDVIG